MTGTIEHHRGGTTFIGEGVTVFAMIALAAGLELYARSGVIPNRNYTPMRMLAAAGSYTGRKFKRGEYVVAAQALRARANAVRATLEETRS